MRRGWPCQPPVELYRDQARLLLHQVLSTKCSSLVLVSVLLKPISLPVGIGPAAALLAPLRTLRGLTPAAAVQAAAAQPAAAAAAGPPAAWTGAAPPWQSSGAAPAGGEVLVTLAAGRHGQTCRYTRMKVHQV